MTGHLGQCTQFIEGACWVLNASWALLLPLQYETSRADYVAVQLRHVEEQQWVRVFFVNSSRVSRQQTWRQQWESRADTHYWEDDTYKHRHWWCCCNRVTKQQETSHTDHWHHIVIEIWVSISLLSLPLPLPVYFCQNYQTWLYSKQLNRASTAAFSSSAYSCSATVLYSPSFVCILYSLLSSVSVVC